MSKISMTAEAVRARLSALFPAFNQTLAASPFVDDDGRFTVHGIWSEFSQFYRDQVTDFAPPPIVALFAWIETIVAADPDNHDGLANAVCTCFLENISSTSAGEQSRSLMGASSRAFFDAWHFPENGGA